MAGDCQETLAWGMILLEQLERRYECWWDQPQDLSDATMISISGIQSASLHYLFKNCSL